MERKSLDEINGSVDVPNVYQSAFWQKFLAYSGPGALVAVGYMDPGNWLTSLAGGSQYRYQLLVVLFTAILIAMYMQSFINQLGSYHPNRPQPKQLHGVYLLPCGLPCGYLMK